MNLTREQMVDALAASDIGDGLPHRGLAQLADVCHEVVLGPAEVLLEEGSPGEHIYLLVQGGVEVQFSNYEDGRFQEICKLHKGSVLGEMSMLEGELRSARTITLENCVALAISRSDFFGVLEMDFETGYRVMRNLAKITSRRLRYTNMAIRHGFLN